MTADSISIYQSVITDEDRRLNGIGLVRVCLCVFGFLENPASDIW